MEHASTPQSPEFLLAHSDFVRALAWHLVRDEHAAEDVVQETWLSALKHPPRQDGTVRGWLTRVTRNHVFMRKRSEGRRAQRESSIAQAEGPPSTAEIFEREAARRGVVDALVLLDEPYRSTILLRFYEDLPLREVARRLGVPLETVRTRQKRGLALLRARLDREYGGERRSWCLALLPLTAGVLERTTQELSPLARAARTLTSGAGGASLQTRFLIGGAAVAATWFGAWSLFGPGGRAAEPITPAHRVAASAPEVSRTLALPGTERVALGAQAEASEAQAVLTAEAPTRLRGRIVDADGAPVGGATVLVFHTLRPHFEAGRPVDARATAQTDAWGNFELSDLPRTFFVHAFQGELVAEAGIAAALNTPLELGEVELHLATSMTLRGRVLDTEGIPVPGASVRAKTLDRRGRGRSTGVPGASFRAAVEFRASCDSDGSFVLAGLPALKHVLTVWHPEFLPAAREFEPVGGPRIAEESIEFAMQRGLAVPILVLDPAGDPLPRASVQLCDAAVPKPATLTDDDGLCEFAPVPAGARVFLRAEAPGCATILSEPFEVSPGMAPVRLRMRSSHAISGAVVDLEGRGVPDAKIAVLCRANREPAWKLQWVPKLDSLLVMGTVTSGPDGSFQFQALDEGVFDLLVTPSGAIAPEVFAEACAGASGVRIVLGESRPNDVHFHGSVVDALTGAPVERFTVSAHESARGAAHPPLARTVEDPDGSWSLPARGFGEWSLSVRAEGYAPWRADPATFAPGAQLVDVVLLPQRDLHLRLLDSRGERVARARVICSDAEGHPLPTMISHDYWLNSVRAGSDGEVQLAGLPATSVVIGVRLPEVASIESFPFDLRWPLAGYQELRLPFDLSSPRRAISLELRARAAMESDDSTWFEGRFQVEVFDAAGPLSLSFAGTAEPGRCTIEKPFPYLIQRYTSEGALRDHAFDVLATDLSGGDHAVRVDASGLPRFSASVPAGACRIVVTADGFQATEVALPPGMPAENGLGEALPVTVRLARTP